jgi:hypothetical protein
MTDQKQIPSNDSREVKRARKEVQPKSENKNQRRFSEMIVMEYLKESFGTIKLTIGILRGSGQIVQYCITAIE